MLLKAEQEFARALRFQSKPKSDELITAQGVLLLIVHREKVLQLPLGQLQTVLLEMLGKIVALDDYNRDGNALHIVYLQMLFIVLISYLMLLPWGTYVLCGRWIILLTFWLSLITICILYVGCDMLYYGKGTVRASI